MSSEWEPSKQFEIETESHLKRNLALVLIIVIGTILGGWYLLHGVGGEGVSEKVHTWAKVGNYLKFNWECTENSDWVTYTGSGTRTITVKEVYENYAVVEWTSEVTWSPSAPTWFKPTITTNYIYSWGDGMFIPPDNLRALKIGVVPSGLENDYRGIKSIITPYGTIKSFHLYENRVGERGSAKIDVYYDYNTGFAVRGEVELQIIAFPPVYQKISSTLVDTNIDVAKHGVT